jgi:hypothetical protein
MRPINSIDHLEETAPIPVFVPGVRLVLRADSYELPPSSPVIQVPASDTRREVQLSWLAGRNR